MTTHSITKARPNPRRITRPTRSLITNNIPILIIRPFRIIRISRRRTRKYTLPLDTYRFPTSHLLRMTTIMRTNRQITRHLLTRPILRNLSNSRLHNRFLINIPRFRFNRTRYISITRRRRPTTSPTPLIASRYPLRIRITQNKIISRRINVITIKASNLRRHQPQHRSQNSHRPNRITPLSPRPIRRNHINRHRPIN